MDESTQIEQLLRQFYAEQDKIRGYVFASTRNYHATEEILQSIAIVVAQKATTYDSSKPPSPWFMGIARNKIHQWYSANKQKACTVSFDVLEQCLAHTDSFDSETLSNRQHALSHCIERLPAKQRQVVNLRYLENYDCTQVASQVGRSVQSIYSLLKRLKLELRKCINIQLHGRETA
jgi:RNA polymerase sigma-70 factor (ECF subfamily)